MSVEFKPEPTHHFYFSGLFLIVASSGMVNALKNTPRTTMLN